MLEALKHEPKAKITWQFRKKEEQVWPRMVRFPKQNKEWCSIYQCESRSEVSAFISTCYPSDSWTLKLGGWHLCKNAKIILILEHMRPAQRTKNNMCKLLLNSSCIAVYLQTEPCQSTAIIHNNYRHTMWITRDGLRLLSSCPSDIPSSTVFLTSGKGPFLREGPDYYYY